MRLQRSLACSVCTAVACHDGRAPWCQPIPRAHWLAAALAGGLLYEGPKQKGAAAAAAAVALLPVVKDDCVVKFAQA